MVNSKKSGGKGPGKYSADDDLIVARQQERG